MMTTIRHIVTSIFFGVFLMVTIISITFFVFPLEEWSVLFHEKIYNVPYLLLLAIITITFSSIIGMITAFYWNQRIHYVERQLELVNNNQPLTSDDTYKELQKVEELLEKVQEKFKVQVEHSQRLATERANEREKSLQEVVIQERNRLARDLHDSVSQQLFAASMMMSAINEQADIGDTTLRHQIQMVEKMIHQSQLEMRALLLHLRPAALKGKSLQDGIKDLLKELTDRIPLQVDWKLEEFFIDKGVEDQLFRIVQEAISNTLRHSEASSVHVMLIKRDNIILLRVVDDGKGFDVEKVQTSSYGLQNMEERANDLGGSIKIISLPNKGARLEVKIPSLNGEEE
ncbi:sensor histidine kinase [Pseudogracilibacillus auburnensis]|uniref:Sensor histidine kinase n=1 Tax=Pseudogracilibacillus auburnensis TaxID=1494959 RepID=A0A2V3VT16_9BACI|nr:sensor histidine kinase [Pseudogracilibacillus auburnensis]MBO1004280.1 sensor histidine kinase [Pseudogracilibacillus auburnensis]PXW85032.1 signal transduction histidine kinase [Pseudogracilibacillus auburnensis]